jgi:acyl-CoA thioesterase-1
VDRVNASISGETSLSGRNRLPALLQKYHPSVLVIELGANDGLQGLPLPALRDNLAAMIDVAQKAENPRAAAGYRAAGELRSAIPRRPARIYADLAKTKHTGLVPFLLDGVALDPA